MARINIKYYMYPPEYKPPAAGSILVSPKGLVPKKVIQSSPQGLTCVTLSGIKQKMSVYESQFFNAVECIEQPVANRTYNLITAKRTITCVIYKVLPGQNTYDVIIHAGAYTSSIFGEAVDIFTINNIKFVKTTIPKSSCFVSIALSTLEGLNYKVLPSGINKIEKLLTNAITLHWGMQILYDLQSIQGVIKKVPFYVTTSSALYFNFKIEPAGRKRHVVCRGIGASRVHPSLQIYLDVEDMSAYLPKLRKSISAGSSVYYVGNKINIPNIYDTIWTVCEIKKAKDNPALDICTITAGELYHYVFRKEIKLIKSTTNDKRENCHQEAIKDVSDHSFF